MNGALLWIAGFIVALLAALFAVPYAVDWNSYRGVFEEEASRMLGREVRVAGDVRLQLLPAPFVKFERLRIADTEAGDAFFRAESFTMWLALPPLMQGVLEAKQIELKRPALRLQLDENGSGNWHSFQIRHGALPFAPRQVALQSVKISDGMLAVHAPDGRSLARVEIAEAEFSAPALQGPYRVRAEVKWNGEMREVRGSTAPPDPDGSTRIKVAVRAPGSGNSYTLDGRASNLASRPQFDGQLTATIPVSSKANQLRPATTAGDGHGAPAGPHGGAFEVRAALRADTVSAKLSDLAFSFEQSGQPQLLTGTAEASWYDRPVVKANLSSRWLDLDRIADSSPETTAFETIRRLISALIGYLPTEADVAARIAIDQANMAGDVVSGLTVAIENAGNGLKVKELRAGLPGGSRVNVTGLLTGSGTAEAFDGDVLVRGANLGRFLSWAARGSQFAEAKSGSGFALSAHMSLGAKRLELQKASLDAGPNRMTGDLTYQWDGRRKLSLSIETAHADISGILPGALGPDLLKAELGALVGSASGAGLAEVLPALAQADAHIRIRADLLTDGTRVLHDVDADATIDKGRLKIPRLRASTPEGFNLELDGDVRDFASRAAGALHGVVEASTPAALAEALAIGMPELNPEKRSWLSRLAPLRVAFVSRFGQQGKAAAEITVDGMSRGAPLIATLIADGGLGNWRSAPVDLMLTSESAEAARIARGLLLGGKHGVDESVEPRQGRFVLKVAGTPASDAALFAQVSGGDLQLTLQGRGALPADADPSFTGRMEVTAADAGRALLLAGIPLPAGTVEGGLGGDLEVSFKGAELNFNLKRFEVGGARLNGEIGLTATEGVRVVDLDLKADRASLQRMIALALNGKIDNSPIAHLGEITNWPDEPFNFGNLEQIKGHVRLKSDTMALGEGFGLTDAVLEAELEPGHITMTKLEGKALGGAISGAFKLEKTAAGAGMSGAFGLWGIRLDQITGVSGAPLGSGRLQLTVQLSGQAVTPRALIPVLTGQGELEMKAARWDRLSPAAIESAADAVLAGRSPATGEPLRQVLRSALASAPLPLGDRKVAVELGGGALRISALSIETPQARVTNRTTIDLTELKIDTEWKLEPKAARGSAEALPPISVIYVGPLKSVASLEPRLITDALERELAVRGMERDVEHLERLRREDEARAKAEAERLRALELERLQQMQSAEPQPPTIDVPFPLPAIPPSTGAAPQQPRPAAPRPAAPNTWSERWQLPSPSGL